MRTPSLRKKLFATTLLAGVVTSLSSPLMLAQETGDDDDVTVIEEIDENDEARQEKVVVTGSRIARDSFTSTAPLQVVSAETIREAGLLDLGDILKTTSVISGTQLDQTVTTSGFLGDGGPGGAAIGLRGLEPERTLVLVNGRRYAPAGVEGAPSFPDISLIPSSVVDRIDVLLDGASSVYGSDAVAGVVNVILRDEFDGFNLEAFRSAPEHPGGEQTSLNFILGSSDDKGSFMFAGEYVYNEPLKADSRDWMASDDGIYCNRAIGIEEDGSVTQQCNPSQAGIGILEPTFNLYYGIPGISSETSEYGVANFVNGRGDLAVSPNGYGRWRDYPSFGQQSFDIQPEFQRTSLFLSAKRQIDLFGGVELFSEFSFTNRQTFSNNGRGQFTVPVPQENPFNPFGVNAPAGSAFDGNPQDASSLLLTPWENQIYVELDQYRLIGGGRGDFEIFDRTWDYEVFGGYTRSQGFSERTGINEVSVALASYTTEIGADGNAVCGLNLIAERPESFGGFFGIDPEVCVPVNFFSPTLFSSSPQFAEGDAATDFLRDVRTVTTFVDEQIIGGYTTGVLYDLPAGPLQGVFGFEWREDAIDTRSDSVAQRALLDGFFFDRPTVGSVNIGELYGELLIPLISNQTLIDNLEMEVAGRLVDHEFYGQNSTYSVKGSYSPTDWFTLRGTYGTSFRAPNLRELFLEGQSSFQTGTDPCEVPFTATAFDDDGNPFYQAVDPDTGEDLDGRSDTVLTNCRLEGLDPTDLGLRGGSTSFQAVNGGNTGLDPETSTAWSAGFVVKQPFFDRFDLTLGVNFYDLEINDSVFTPSIGTVLALCYNSDNFPDAAFCTRRSRDPNTGFLSEVDATPFNVAAQTTSGVDYNVNFQTDFKLFGQEMDFDADLEITEIDDLSTLVTIPGEPIEETNLLGEVGFPEWRGVFRSNLEVGNYTLFWQTRYIGESEPSEDPTATVGEFALVDVDEYYVSDVSLSYRANDWTLRFGVQNLFDEEPPLIDQDAADESNIGSVSDRNVPLGIGYDQIGRRAFVSVSKTF